MKHTQSVWGPRRGAGRGEKEEKGGVRNETSKRNRCHSTVKRWERC